VVFAIALHGDPGYIQIDINEDTDSLGALCLALLVAVEGPNNRAHLSQFSLSLSGPVATRRITAI